MPRKNEMQKPQKCRSCDKVSNCEILRLMPFDASGILLDCKAFYIVFCDLEERCRVPFGDQEAMDHDNANYLAGKKPFLQSALVTNGILAAELALKALTLKETGTFDCIHEIDKLYYHLPDIHRAALTPMIMEKAHQNEVTLKTNLETISNFFVNWRYFFQYNAIGYSGFLLDFIHTVCDYAISNIENSMTVENG